MSEHTPTGNYSCVASTSWAVFLLLTLITSASAKDHDGLREDGKPDARLSSEHGFGSRREQASQAGQEVRQTRLF